VINIRESFWTIPRAEWDALWVWVRWDDFPIPPPVIDWKSGAEYVNIAELATRPITAEFGFRSLEVCGERRWSGGAVVSPLLLDLDLDGDSQGNLDDLLHRVEAEVKFQGWRYQVYQSGTGYHVELDPASREGVWGLSSGYARELQDEIRRKVDGQCDRWEGGKACIDKTEGKMARMVESAHRAGTFKERIEL
jgi:hypothetical protein